MKTCRTCQQTFPDDIEFCPSDGARLAAKTVDVDAQIAGALSRHFHIVRRLGAGGMGTVFLAEQIGVGNRPVALKVLSRKLLDDPEFMERFLNEAGSTGRINHPNVVTIYESGQADDGTPFIAMQYLEGENLGQILRREGALPLPEVAEILQQVARGLNAAHKVAIIHRDIKPDNIFLTRGEEGELIVKVVDFGIAKLRESSTHTMTGTALGTPAYMSYEQAFGMRSDELDARSDIYSLGVVVYEMLTGSLPFNSETPAGFLRKHVNEAPPSFRNFASGLSIPAGVEAVVDKALAKNRDQRYSSAIEFARDFTQAVSASAHADASEPGPTIKINAQDIEDANRESLAQEKAVQERQAQEKAEAGRRERENVAAAQAARAKAQQEALAHAKAEADRREKENAAAQLAARNKNFQPPPTAPAPNITPPEAAGQSASPWLRKKGRAGKILSILSAGIAVQFVLGIIGATLGVYLHTPDAPKNASEGWLILCTISPAIAFLVYGMLVIRYGMKSRSLNEPAISDDLMGGARMGTRLAIVLLLVGALSYVWALSVKDGYGWSLFWTSGPLGVGLTAFLFSRRWNSKARRG